MTRPTLSPALPDAVAAVRDGATAREAARRYHVHYYDLLAACHAEGVPLKQGSPKGVPHRQPPERQARDAAILAAALTGEAHTDIAARFGVHRERVRQIVKRLNGPPGREALRQRQAVQRAATQARHAAAREAADRAAEAARDARLAPVRALRAAGESYEAIAARLGVATMTVYRWLNPRKETQDHG